jgi:hypothetical protein
MKKLICNIINTALKPFNLALQTKDVQWERDALAALYEALSQRIYPKSKYPAECIVFSKDRALQLHALLSSYYEKVTNPLPVHVLYHTTDIFHQKVYDEVIALFHGHQISFIKQNSKNTFRKDLITLLESLQANKVLFLVDDLIFIEDVNLEDFVKFDPDKFVPSLRLGQNLTYCYTLQKQQPLPEFSNILENDKLFWKWKQGEYDWGYPLSVDGHLFSTQEITSIARLVSFNAPNTFEDGLQRFKRLFSIRAGVCYHKSKIVNIPCNKVQRENENICGNIHQDFLLEQWNKGLRLDYQRLYGVTNVSAHQEIAIELTQR